MPKPLFHSVSRPHRSGHHGYSIYDVFLGVFVGFLLTATGMHFVYNKMPSDDPSGALNAAPLGVEEPHYEHIAQQPNMESLQFLREEVQGRDRAPRPHARIEREVDEYLEAFMDEKEGEAPADKVEVEIVEKEHDVRWGVDITAVEEDPVEKIDVTLPGMGGNQPCAEAGADILPGWVCVKRNRIERRPTITPEELADRYFKQGIPAILTDFVTKKWKVFTEDAWAPLKLKERFGQNLINVQMGREKDPDFEIHQHLLRKDMKFGDYIDMVLNGGESNDYYITANNHFFNRRDFQDMLADTKPFFPGFMKETNNGPGTYYWLGAKGTITPLHQDAVSLFHVHMQGRKLWRFISPDQKELLYNNYGVYSDVDLLLPWDDLVAKYPLMLNTTIITEVLQPGETVFIPNGWFHHVIGLDHPVTSMSTTVWLKDFLALETRLHMRWNSLHKPQSKQPVQDKAARDKALMQILVASADHPAQDDNGLKEKISVLMSDFKKSMRQNPTEFHAARKELFKGISRDKEVAAGLLWVLAHEKLNRIKSDWRNWVLINVSRQPGVMTIIDVMKQDMMDSDDVWGIVDSWFSWLGKDEKLHLLPK